MEITNMQDYNVTWFTMRLQGYEQLHGYKVGCYKVTWLL